MVTTVRPRATAPAHAAGPPPRTVLLIGGMILLAVLVLAAVAVSVWRVRHASVDRASHTVTAAVAGRDQATLDLLSGVTAVTVTAADLGDVLYRVRTPDGGRMVPSVTDLDGRVGVQLNDTGNGADKGVVTVELNRDVRWTVRFTAGATSNTADLRGLREIGGVEYIGGVSSIELSLPAAKGVVPVRMSGGASTFRVHLPQGRPVRVVAGGGAGSVTVDGARHDGVAGGAAFQSGDPAAADRYEIDNTAGVSSVVVDRY
ncbi:hypothetical protein OHA72_61325 [Dactylosporangium sp. NBC_01737]|uniref:hypothetical protein n=1 Tax=Dactylosporangium sp. NBC_01737 TaxID=2975959 RepID=UPI002E12D687|nr:hypothetical protein OHA72_61325 [Dactylosporangium sp. NBC_01737]